jgi:hypothetical protein
MTRALADRHIRRKRLFHVFGIEPMISAGHRELIEQMYWRWTFVPAESGVRERRCTALQCCGDAFADVAGERAQDLGAGLGAQMLAEFADADGAVEQILGLADAEWRVGGDPGGEFDGGGHIGAFVDDA